MAPEQRRGDVSPAVDVYASARQRDRPHAAPKTSCCRRTLAQALSIADELQAHLLKIGHPDPAKRPTTIQALAESQRVRELIIAASSSSIFI